MNWIDVEDDYHDMDIKEKERIKQQERFLALTSVPWRFYHPPVECIITQDFSTSSYYSKERPANYKGRHRGILIRWMRSINKYFVWR